MSTTPSAPLRHSRPGRRILILRLLTALLLVAAGIAMVAATNHLVVWSSSDHFCGQVCHSMTWANAAYRQSSHYQNPVGVRASCGACHIPYDSSNTTTLTYIYLLGFKTDRGVKDFWNEARRTIATKQEWEERRPRLQITFTNFLTKHNYVTCRGCHQLSSFGGPRSEMKSLIHSKVLTANAYDCLHCHSEIGHVYESASGGSPAAGKKTGEAVSAGDWYNEEQATSGSHLFQQHCSSCHGIKLEGGAGPALIGTSWKQLYSGAKLLTVWGEIHGPMAQYAGATFSEQQSIDILAFLLQQNGLPSGPKALVGTEELNRRIPVN